MIGVLGESQKAGLKYKSTSVLPAMGLALSLYCNSNRDSSSALDLKEIQRHSHALPDWTLGKVDLKLEMTSSDKKEVQEHCSDFPL